jgi:hypothetical protein
MSMTRLREERGSLPLAMIMTIVLVAIGGVLTTSAIAGQRHTRFDQTFEVAVQRAEAGADRLAHMVRKRQIVTATTVSGPGYTATATPSGGGWVVTGTGTSGTAERTVEIRMKRQRLFRFGVFADESIKMVGSPPNVRSYDSASWNTGQGSLASNGPIAETHNTWDAKHPNLQPAMDYRSDEAVQFIRDACEGTTPQPLTITGTRQLAAGDYCVSNLTFAPKSITTVTGPVRLYVFGVTTIGADAQINCNVGCVVGSSTRPIASNLQILTVAETPIIFGKGLRMAAAVFAPRAQCTTMPFVRVFGALNCWRAQLQRAFFQLHYDERLFDVGGDWAAQWKEQ